jgi:hypothetical protein
LIASFSLDRVGVSKAGVVERTALVGNNKQRTLSGENTAQIRYDRDVIWMA